MLLITIDTLRADALGASGNPSARTPWLDRLAAGGVRFSNARAHNVVTLPSHANILTGRLPPDHGDSRQRRLPPRATEETARDAARTATAFARARSSARFRSTRDSAWRRGFDVYDDAFVDVTPRPAFLEQERAGVETVAAATRWLGAPSVDRSGKGRQPSFCWVHLYEPHFPYAPPEPFADPPLPRDPYAEKWPRPMRRSVPLLQPILDRGDEPTRSSS